MASLMLVVVNSRAAQDRYKEFTYEESGLFKPHSRFLCEHDDAKIMSIIMPEDERLLGYRVLNENLEYVKELKVLDSGIGIHVREVRYAGDSYWTEVSRDTTTGFWTPFVGYYDSSNIWEGLNVCQESDVCSNSIVNVTQTMFNDDEAYELIQPIYGESRVVSYNYDFTERSIYINARITEYAVTDENGSILHSIKPRSGFVFGEMISVVGLENKVYLTVNMRDIASGEDDIICFYEINKEAGSMPLVREMTGDYRFGIIDGKFLYDNQSRLAYRKYNSSNSDKGTNSTRWDILTKKLNADKSFSIPRVEWVRTTEKRNTDNGLWEEVSREVRFTDTYLMSLPKSYTASHSLFDYGDVDYYDAVGLDANITQTLFNDDGKYEIFTPVYGGKVVTYDKDYLSRETYTNHMITAYNIVDEEGTILYAIEAGEDACFGEVAYVYDIYDRRYLMMLVFSSNSETPIYRYYEINQKTTSIDLIREVKDEMKVSPTVADKNDVITVTLNSPKKNALMVLTSVSGQIVKRKTLTSDEKYITLDAATLRSGVYSISLHTDGAIIDSEKIIIK